MPHVVSMIFFLEINIYNYVHFQTHTLKKKYEFSYLPAPTMDLLVPLLFYKDGFSIKYQENYKHTFL